VEAVTPKDRQQRTDEFVEAIKATVTFSVYWRGAKGGTENIDSHYRDIMRTSITVGSDSIPPMARHVEGKLGALSLANYKKGLRLILEARGGIKSKDDWVKLAARMPVYRHSTTLARFLIFCASDDAMPDAANKGLIVPGRKGVSPMLTLERWQEADYFTVEHIAPQSVTTGWATDIYEDPDTVHVLGNLTLLPHSENAVIANKPWAQKRMIYSLLSAETQVEFDKIAAELGKVGLTLSKTAQEVMNNAKYLGLCKSVAVYDKDWDKAIIELRSERIASLAWERLHAWLYA
jgi:hypothetical protein